MSWTQGDPLPNIDTSKTTETAAPAFYDTYLQDIAKVGSAAIERDPTANVAGLTQAQRDAITAGSNITAGDADITGARSSLASAGQISAESAANPYLSSGTASSVSNINAYMDPYRTNVVNEIGRLGMENLNQVLLPQQTGRSVGYGDFGSSRAGRAYGATARGGLRDIMGAQSGSLSAGYKSALEAASRDLQRQIEAAKIAGDTATADALARRQEAIVGRDIGTTALDMELRGQEQQFKMGERERAYNQDIMNEPLVTAKNAADLFSNLKVPTTVTEKASAPIPGAYSTSPLSNLLGAASLFSAGRGSQSAADAILSTVLGTTAYNSLKATGVLPSITNAIARGDIGSGTVEDPSGVDAVQSWYESLSDAERTMLNNMDFDVVYPIIEDNYNQYANDDDYNQYASPDD